MLQCQGEGKRNDNTMVTKQEQEINMGYKVMQGLKERKKKGGRAVQEE